MFGAAATQLIDDHRASGRRHRLQHHCPQRFCPPCQVRHAAILQCGSSLAGSAQGGLLLSTTKAMGITKAYYSLHFCSAHGVCSACWLPANLLACTSPLCMGRSLECLHVVGHLFAQLRLPTVRCVQWSTPRASLRLCAAQQPCHCRNHADRALEAHHRHPARWQRPDCGWGPAAALLTCSLHVQALRGCCMHPSSRLTHCCLMGIALALHWHAAGSALLTLMRHLRSITCNGSCMPCCAGGTQGEGGRGPTLAALLCV